MATVSGSGRNRFIAARTTNIFVLYEQNIGPPPIIADQLRDAGTKLPNALDRRSNSTRCRQQCSQLALRPPAILSRWQQKEMVEHHRRHSQNLYGTPSDQYKTSSRNEGSAPVSKSECTICGGMGFIIPDVPPIDPRFGRAVPCTCKNKANWRTNAVPPSCA